MLLKLLEGHAGEAGHLTDGGQRVQSLQLANEIVIGAVALLCGDSAVVAVEHPVVLELLDFCLKSMDILLGLFADFVQLLNQFLALLY